MDITPWSGAFTDSISTGICIINSKYEVLVWNDYLQIYTGIELEDIRGKQIGKFFPAFMEARYTERIDRIFGGWPPLYYSSRLNHLFGRPGNGDEAGESYQDVSVAPLPDRETNGYLALITVTDVTDLNRKLEERNQLYRQAREEIRSRKQAEEKLRASESKLRDLNHTKDRLISIIAHDLRGPVASNINGISALLSAYDRSTDEQRKELLSALREGTEHTYRLLEDLLSWARLQSDKTQLVKVPLSVREILEAEAGKLRHVAAEKGIALHTECPSDSLIEADINMMRTILRNLLTNAIKFTHPGGEVFMESEPREDNVVIRIRDTGVGMTDEIRSGLFKLEELRSTKGTGNESGTGFGLILTREFVEKTGGQIHVESSPGKGSTFTVALPKYKKSKP